MDLHDKDNSDADKPLLLVSESSGGDVDEFYDANPSEGEKATPAVPAESFFGKASPLSTGLLFSSTSGRGIVDSLPSGDPEKACLLFADHDPMAAVSHICLLEKEFRHWEAGGTRPAGDGPGPALFTVVHVCEPLAARGDAGMRLLRKIDRGRGLLGGAGGGTLLHRGNIFREAGGRTAARLLPFYIDEAIGERDLLKPDDAIGRYNMNNVGGVQGSLFLSCLTTVAWEFALPR